MMQPEQKKTIRNLIIFIVVGVIGLPWLGWALDVGRNADPHNQQDSLGWLLFIIAPLTVAALLRTFAGDGWKDFGIKPAFKGNGKWYLFALLFPPLGTVLILLIGAVAGVTSFPNLSPAGFALAGQAILMAFLPNFVKNIFEEFSWRGHLAPKMQLVARNSLLGHVLVGLVWFTWHLPYYLVLLSPELVRTFTSLDSGTFLLMSALGIIPTAIIYGEIRLRTNSVWPAVLIHTVSNSFYDVLMIQKFFSLPVGWPEFIFSPALFSVCGILLNLAVGLWLYRQRTNATGG